MKQVSLVEARKSLTHIVNQVEFQNKQISITRHGKPAAVVISVEDAEMLAKVEDMIDIREAEIAMKEEGSISSADLRKKLGLAK